MSLSSTSGTSALKAQLSEALGANEQRYWETFHFFLHGQLSRVEFEDTVRECLDSPQLIQLHNTLVISCFDTSYDIQLPSTSSDAPKKPARKKRRMLPYQGPDEVDAVSLRSERLKKWVVGVGKRERERVRALSAGLRPPDAFPVPPHDELRRERGVVLLRERGEPPGSRLALHLAATNHRAPTLQQLSERINLICAQHNLAAPSKHVATLMMSAFETKLKQLIIRTIALTSSSRAIASIRTSSGRPHTTVLTASSFDTLFTLTPSMLPNQSAAAMRLALGETEHRSEETAEPAEGSVLQALIAQRSGFQTNTAGGKSLLA